MSRSLEEVIRIKLESAGVENVDALVKAFSELEQSGELTQDELSGLVDKLTAVTDAAGDIKGIEAAIDSYRTLGEQQALLRAEVERTGLALELAAQQERGAAEAYAQTISATAEARQALEEYRKSADRTREGLDAHRTAVREAVQAEREAKTAYNDSARALAQAFSAFDDVDDQLASVSRRLGEAGKAITDASLSTDDLAQAQAELAKRSEAAGASVAAMVRDAEQAAEANRALARATAEAAAAAAQAERDFDEAFRALGGGSALRDTTDEIRKLEAAYETLAKSGKLSTEQLERAQEQLQVRVQKLREGTAEYRAEQERAARAQESAAYFAKELASAEAKATAAQKETAEAIKRQAAESKNAAAAQNQMGDAASRNVGIFQKLRGVVAGLAAYVGFREALQGIKNILGIGDAAEKTRIQLSQLYGSQDEGNRAFRELRQIARDNALAFEETLNAAARLKSFGLEPLDGTMQALIDQNAALGGSQQNLEGMILAVGQAWAKQKLQGEEILQLVERGVPVWDLLSKATGRTTEELTRMASAGELGRDTIRALIAEIGKANTGAAEANMSRLSALVEGLRTRFTEFLERIANSGALDYFRGRLQAVTKEIDALVRDGRMERWARNISDSIITLARAAEGAVRFVVEYGKAITALAVAYTAAKTAQAGSALVATIVAMGNASGAAAAKVVGFSKAVKGLSAAGAVTTALGGLATAARGVGAAMTAAVGGTLGLAAAVAAVFGKAGWDVGQRLQDWRVRTSELGQALSMSAAEAEKFGEVARRRSLDLIQYENVTLKAAAAVAQLGESERAAYLKTVAGHEAYIRAVRESINAKMIAGTATREEIELNRQLRDRWIEIRDHTREVNRELELFAKRAAEIKASGLSEEAFDISRALRMAVSSAEGAGAEIEKLFASFSKLPTNSIRDMALALVDVASRGDFAAGRIRDGLAAELKKLTGEELLKFQQSATAAFDEAGTSAKDAAVVVDTVLMTALERLGLKGQQIGQPFTEAGRDIMATFQAIAESANATSEQIEAAFKAAINAAATREEAEAMGEALKQAAEAGRVSFEAMSRSTDQLNAKLRELEAAANPLNDAFQRLGITSQQALQAAADTAKDAFQQIVDGSRRGEAAMGDVRRAFEAYARAQLDATAGMDAHWRRQVEMQLKVEGGAIGAREELERLGLAGEDAGNKTADAMGRAGTELQNVADAASDAAQAMDGVTSSATTAAGATQQMAEGMGHVTRSVQLANNELQGTSKLYKELANPYAFERVGAATALAGRHALELYQRLQEQTSEYEKQLAALQEQNMALDAVGQRVLELRRKFSYLSDDRLRVLAQEQLRYEQATGQSAEQNRMLGVGNDLLRARNKLLEQQKQVTQVQEIKRTTEVNVNFTAKATNINFDPSDLTDSQWRQVAAKVIEIIKRDMP